MRNTNGLIGRYPGADGMKTGFICSAGFNVVASATRNGRHLITVVMGAPSANERTMKAAELFDRGFNIQANWSSPTLTALPQSASTTPPDMRSVICDRRGPMPEEDSSTTLASDQNSGVPNLFSSDMMAFAGGATPVRTSLLPRSAVQPERVWVGLNPPSESEIAAEAAKEAAAAAKAREAKAEKAKSAKNKKQKGKTSDDQIATEADDEPKVEKAETKGKARATISVKPVTAKAKEPAASKEPATKQAAVKDVVKDSAKETTKAAGQDAGEGRQDADERKARLEGGRHAKGETAEDRVPRKGQAGRQLERVRVRPMPGTESLQSDRKRANGLASP